MMVQGVHLGAYDLAEVRTDTEAVALAEDDVYIHSYALGLGTLVHISQARIVGRYMG